MNPFDDKLNPSFIPSVTLLLHDGDNYSFVEKYIDYYGDNIEHVYMFSHNTSAIQRVDDRSGSKVVLYDHLFTVDSLLQKLIKTQYNAAVYGTQPACLVIIDGNEWFNTRKRIRKMHRFLDSATKLHISVIIMVYEITPDMHKMLDDDIDTIIRGDTSEMDIEEIVKTL